MGVDGRRPNRELGVGFDREGSDPRVAARRARWAGRGAVSMAVFAAALLVAAAALGSLAVLGTAVAAGLAAGWFRAERHRPVPAPVPARPRPSDRH